MKSIVIDSKSVGIYFVHQPNSLKFIFWSSLYHYQVQARPICVREVKTCSKCLISFINIGMHIISATNVITNTRTSTM